MRAALTIAALAAGALAVPYKRDLVTEVDMVYVTDIVTVTAGQPVPTANHVHKHHHHSKSEASTPPAFTDPPVAAPTAAFQALASTIEVALPSVQAPASQVQAAPAAAPTSYQAIVLYHHNLHRQNHSAAPLEWDAGLEASAQTIAASCVYAHNVDVDGGGYGQNIAAGVEASNISSVITDMFYNGEEPYFAPNYGLADPDMSGFEEWGHFSQIVWKGTTHVACATQYCPSGLGNVGSDVQPYFTVCNYKNPGNYAGEYGANINAPIGMATANWNTGL